MPDNGTEEAGPSTDDICRDFLRNVCNRGKRCKFRHPDANEMSTLGLLSSDLPVNKGEIPICHDYQKGDCQRGPKCKFLHVKRDEYGYENQGMAHSQVFSPLARRYDRYDDLYSRGYDADHYDGYDAHMKRRRMEGMGFEVYDYGMQNPGAADYRFLKEENLMLQKRVEDLQKQVSNLMATNELLLEQNANLRNQVKMGMMTPMTPMTSMTAMTPTPTATAGRFTTQ